MASLSDKIGTRIAGRYELQRELGQGGMATAYLAHDLSLDCSVVIKSPHAALLTDPTFTRRFQQEMRSLVKLSHPHIVKITDVGEHEGVPFFVMQYLGGGSLRDRQGNPKTRQPVDQLRDWLTKIAEALDFMHDRGYVHRDVKPANILFDEHGHAYLSDFGVAKALRQEGETESSSSLTGTGMVLGTPDYLAPEVILGEKSDGRADQYALAITVYELLGGRCPFEGPTPMAVLVQHSTAKPRPLEQLVPDLPEGLCNAVHRGLAKGPRNRYSSCREMAEAVLAAISLPTSALPLAGHRAFKPASDKTIALASPSSEEIPRAICPKCGRRIKLPKDSVGRFVACPACETRLTVSAEYGLTFSAQEIGTNRSIIATVRTGVTSGSSSQWHPQITGNTPSATKSTTTNTSLTARAWYRVPWIQAVLAGLALTTLTLVVALPPVKPRSEVASTSRETQSKKTLPRSTAAPSATNRPNSMPAVYALAPNEINNSIGMIFKLIPKGTFTMGSPSEEEYINGDEQQHQVTISRDYYLCIYEVTQGQYEKVMGGNPSNFHETDSSMHPVELVSVEAALDFCERLSELPEEKSTGRFYRLPTEAEWEFACRSGSQTAYSFGNDSMSLGDYAWYGLNSNFQTHPVGQKKPNVWGLYDMHGNVWEWCADWYGDYPTGAVTDPVGPERGSSRVLRGGSFLNETRFCRSATRSGDIMADRGDIDFGFRVVLIPTVSEP